MMNKFIKSYNNFTAKKYESNPKVRFWMRSLHRTGGIFAYQFGEKDEPINCFAVFTDGTIREDHHHNLVCLFKDG
jgi:hypothetical protein